MQHLSTLIYIYIYIYNCSDYVKSALVTNVIKIDPKYNTIKYVINQKKYDYIIIYNNECQLIHINVPFQITIAIT